MAVPYHTHSFEIPSATKAEVEAGVRTDVAATPASLGSAASKDVSYFATAGQGGNADTAVQSVNGKTGKVITLAKGDIGLGNTDNTSDADKPISTAAQAALNLKANTSDLGTAAGRNAEEFATAAQGALASTAAQQATIFTAGSGLTGGGTLATNRTFALSSTSLASLALADTAVQTINGKSGRAITLSSDDVSAVPIARETEIIANTAARHTHSNKAVLDATTAAFTTAMSSKLAGIPADADKTPGIATVTSDGLMSSGDKTKINGIAAGATANTGTVTSVAVTVPAGLAVAGAPITTAGTFAISYAAGYRGYTTAEANKLAGIPADADKTPALAAVATSGNYTDLNGKPTLGSLAAKNNIAVADISATGTPSAATFLRGDGTWGTVAGAGTVTSVGLSAPTGFAVSGSPVTGSGTLTIAYASGYQGYTTAEANKLAGIAVGADKTPALAAVATTGNYSDLNSKPTLGTAAGQNIEAFATADQGIKADGAVRFDVSQTPEIGQQITARYNIGAAGQDDMSALESSINSKLDTKYGYNYIMNGAVEVWQRGDTNLPFGFIADRWGLYRNNGAEAGTVSRILFPLGQTDVPGNASSFMRANMTNGGPATDGYIGIGQSIEGVRNLAGKKATITFYAKSDSPKKIFVELNQTFGAGGSGSSPRLNIKADTVNTSTTWQRFDILVDIPSISGKTITYRDFLGITFTLSAGSNFGERTDNLGIQTGVFDITRVSIVEGDARLIADPLYYRGMAQETELCKRFYQTVSEIVLQAASTSGHANRITVLLPVQMRASPTITYGSATGTGVAIVSSSTGDRLVLAAFPGADGLIAAASIKCDAEL